MPKPLQILIVEDCESDAELIVHELKREGYEPKFERVDTAEAMEAALKRHSWDIIICDYVMPRFGGMEALALYKERGGDIPFIGVSGVIKEEVVVNMMRSGAHDCVLKSNFARLGSAIARELGSAQERRKHRRAEEMAMYMAAIVEGAEDAIISRNLEGFILSWNRAAERLYGYTAAEMIGSQIKGLVPPDRRWELDDILGKLNGGERIEPFETQRARKDGKNIDVSLTISPVRNREGKIIGVSDIVHDITERKRHDNEQVKLIGELTDALTQVKTLRGLLPICASCKKIRDDRGYWQKVETYVKKHSEADFTHGICPDCIKRLYPNVGI